MRFIWNDSKAKTNKAKHRMSFTEAKRFEFDTAMISVDDSEDYGEERLIATGFIGNRLCYLVYTPRGRGIIRVISLRPATKQEANDYVAYIERGY